MGRFELLEAVGTGAFGTVYRARDPELDRIVALKLPRAGNLPDGEHLDRFLREARSAAQLRHPAIVPIHEVSQDNSTPYLVSDFVVGVTLADVLTSRRLAIAESVRLVKVLAEALHFAHQHGVVHRDVKPSNIMLDADMKPHLMDFGLAKRDAGEITMTMDGQVLGTPAYMSPEQARGEAHRVDGRSDVYSLGVILYLLLTGELPFRGNVRMLLHQVLHDEPRPPHSINDRVPRDLQTICLKAMAKEPARRYQTAAELAADLDRFLEGVPIKAHPVGRTERLWRWCRRNPALAATSALAMLALLTATVVSVVFAVHQSAALEDSETHRRSLAAANRKSAHMALGQGVALCEQGEVARGILWLGHSLAIAPPDDVELHESARFSLAVWQSHLPRVRPIVLDQDKGRHWMGQLMETSFGPDRGSLALKQNKNIRVWDLHRGKIRGDVSWGEEISCYALSPDGRRLALAGSKVLQVLDITSGEPLYPPWEQEGIISCLIFSPDGSRVLTGGKDKMVRQWELATGKLIKQFTLPAAPWQMRIHPQKRVLAALAGEFAAIAKTLVVHLDDGKSICEPKTPPVPAFMEFSSDGNVAATVGGADVQLWEVLTGKLLGKPLPHPAVSWEAAFSPDGTVLATACLDGNVRLWSMTERKQLGAPLRHPTVVSNISFSKDGRTLFARGQGEHFIRAWELVPAQTGIKVLAHPEGKILSATFSRDGSLLATCGDKVVRLWDVHSGAPSGAPLPFPDAAWWVAFTPDDQMLVVAAAAPDEQVETQIWDLAKRQLVQKPRRFPFPSTIPFFRLSHDGKLLLTFPSPSTMQLQDVFSGKPVGDPLSFQAIPYSVECGQDRKTFVTLDADMKLQTWDLRTLQPVGKALQLDALPTSMNLSPDGRLLLVAQKDNSVRLWQARTAEPFGRPLRHSSRLSAAALRPDGSLLATACWDGEIHLWRIPACTYAGSLPAGSGLVRPVQFSPEGKLLLIVNGDKATLRTLPEPVSGDIERIATWIQVITGMELDDAGNERVLDPATWEERRRQLEKLGGSPVAKSTTDKRQPFRN